MHTFTTYQFGAVRNAEDLDNERLLLNLMIAVGGITQQIVAVEDANTKPLNMSESSARLENEAVDAAIGAILFNVSVLADRFGVDLAALADVQLAKVEGITNSGRLRMLAGGVK